MSQIMLKAFFYHDLSWRSSWQKPWFKLKAVADSRHIILTRSWSFKQADDHSTVVKGQSSTIGGQLTFSRVRRVHVTADRQKHTDRKSEKSRLFNTALRRWLTCWWKAAWASKLSAAAICSVSGNAISYVTLRSFITTVISVRRRPANWVFTEFSTVVRIFVSLVVVTKFRAIFSARLVKSFDVQGIDGILIVILWTAVQTDRNIKLITC